MTTIMRGFRILHEKKYVQSFTLSQSQKYKTFSFSYVHGQGTYF